MAAPAWTMLLTGEVLRRSDCSRWLEPKWQRIQRVTDEAVHLLNLDCGLRSTPWVKVLLRHAGAQVLCDTVSPSGLLHIERRGQRAMQTRRRQGVDEELSR